MNSRHRTGNIRKRPFVARLFFVATLQIFFDHDSVGRGAARRADEDEDERPERLRAFWRAQMDGWSRSDLNQREYCEANRLSLKNSGIWRAQLKYEDTVTDRKARWRRRPKMSPVTSPMTSPMTEETEPREN